MKLVRNITTRAEGAHGSTAVPSAPVVEPTAAVDKTSAHPLPPAHTLVKTMTPPSAGSSSLGVQLSAAFVTKHRAAHAAFLEELHDALGTREIGGAEAARQTTAHADALLSAIDAQVVKEIGEAPAAYAVFATGSYGRGELAPYSDLDFGVVIETDSEPMRGWVDRWSRRVAELLVAVGDRGLEPCREMSPTGFFGPFFVGTPQQIAARLAGTDTALSQRPARDREFIATGLAGARLACARGNGAALYAKLEVASRDALGGLDGPRGALLGALLASLRDPFGVPERPAGWLDAPGGAPVDRPPLKRHQPLAPEDAIAQGKVNAKHDLLRAFQIPLQALRVLFDLNERGGDDVLAALSARGLIDDAFAGKLRDSLDACMRMRALNQLGAGAPEDALRSLSDEDKRAIRIAVPLLFRLRQGMESLKHDAPGRTAGFTLT